MKGTCELCSNQARIYCESDQARLCWNCDEKVHCANFLVAKHCRSLLCHVCYTTTPWKASGSKLGPTISVCQSCFHGCNESKPRREEEINQPRRRLQDQESDDGDDDDAGSYSSCSDSDSDGDEEDDDSVEDEEDEGENQVVPWSCCSSTSGPDCNRPPVESCSSSEELGGDGGASVSSTLKRFRGTANLDSDDEDGCSSKLNHNITTMECGMPSSSSLRPLKIAKTSDLIQQIQDEISEPKRRRLGVLTSIVRFQQKLVDGEDDTSAIIQEISRISRDS